MGGDEFLGVIGHRKPRESRVGDGVVGYEYKEPVEEISEVPPVVEPPIAPPRKPRLFYLLEQVLGQLGLLTDEVIKLRPRPTLGVYYNSGIKTIKTATAANLDQPSPPKANYPNREYIYDIMGRTANVNVLNEGPGNIFILVSSNEVRWATEELPIGYGERVEIDDAYEIALRTSTANTQYIATEYPIRTSKTTRVGESLEIQIFDDEEIRDVAVHNSDIANIQRFTIIALYVQNTLDAVVAIQVYTNRVDSITGAVTVGAPFNVAALAGVESRTLTPDTSGWLPFIFVSATAAGIPALGNLNAYTIGQN